MARTTGENEVEQASGSRSLLTESMGYLVRRTHRAFTRSLEKRLKEYDISISMWFFLRLLWVEDGMNQKEISEELGLTQPTTVAAMDKMEKRGLIERRRNSQDRRQVNIFLTPAGRALEKRLAPYAPEVNAVALEGLDARERKTAQDLLFRMIRALDQDAGV